MIKIENLTVAFGGRPAVKNVSLEIADGEILGVVGESGSGKSVTALTLMGLASEEAQVTSGRILFDDVALLEAGRPRDKELYRQYQGNNMSMVFQEPMTSLNPTQRVGRQVEEVLRLHTELTREQGREKVLASFASVGLRDAKKVYDSYPHQLSGGMRQRVMIAMAVILHPRLIVADEPTTALDVTIQNQIVELLREINEKQNNSMLFITHDLNLARRICHRIAVMKDGEVVEYAPAEDIFGHPKGDYTRRLIEAVPSRMKKRRRKAFEGGFGAEAGEKTRENAGQAGSAAQAGGMGQTESIEQAESIGQAGNIAQTESIEQAESIGQAGSAAQAKGIIQAGSAAWTKDTAQAESRKQGEYVLEVRDLNVYYRDGNNSLFSGNKKHCVVEDATFAIRKGEIMGLVGESGCGKTSLSRAILGMNREIQGSVVHYSLRPQMIFQDPYSSLNPARTIGWLLQEPLRAQGRLDRSRRMTKADMEAAAYDMLRRVGMEESYFHRRPSQLSGGQRQRVSIGQALITRPGLVIADEPVSALDVTIQAQIMELMRAMQEEMKLSYLFISHDINVIYQMSDRIMVMKNGRILEMGDTEEVFCHPKEDYTKLLLAESV